ncbi:uncharacterized protein RAG0_03724 [Rhynchosporium agropyri]|uniref:Uncharacterized protein n=1 Tax=Rhynchosporium agropyri TaxID=914238 RepID=A0A1E1K5P1_9HELO|nr:uncharacterized protein RAG0_03724 [Rhynchosporium agropyri]
MADDTIDDRFVAFARQNRKLLRDYTDLEVPDCARDFSKKTYTTIWDLTRVKQAGSLTVPAHIRAIISYSPAAKEKLEDFPQYGERLVELIGISR